MIRKYTFGHPFPTEAVVTPMQAEHTDLPFLYWSTDGQKTTAALRMEQSVLNTLKTQELGSTDEGGKPSLCYRMEKDDIVYGLGQSVRGINKRGWSYTAYATDEPNQTESTRSLYAAHNFLLIDGRSRFGVFLDHPGEVEFDIGYTDLRLLRITPTSLDMDVYIIEGDSLRDIVKQFRRMIGRSYIAPRWALGYGQSRWGYETAQDIRDVCDGYRERDIGLDMIYLDIDYMRGYRNFTVDDTAFPNFSEFVREMRSRNIHLIPIIDAGVKAEQGYVQDDEGVQNGYFVKNEDGTDFVGTVWPGEVHFPDFLNAQARAWFGDHYRFLLAQGIDGFWNDMNEPAVFYSKNGMRRLRDSLQTQLADGTLTDEKINGLGWEIGALKNSREDYRSMYHDADGRRVCHDDVHNLYGFYMTRAAAEAFARELPDRRVLLFSRSSYTGMHRYGGIWTGDNQSWWSHLRMNLTMLPGLSMQGFLYSGADLGGFGSDCTEDLLLRWLALSLFTPLMRNHSAKGTRMQEVYRFGDTAAFRRLIGLRYYLLPYIYSEYMKACLGDEMLFRPLAFDYEDDPHAPQVEDQLLMGDSIMIAPILQQNATGRYVYLPEEMRMLRLRDCGDYDSQILPQGHHYVSAATDEVLLFIRPDRMIVVSDGGRCEADVDFEHVKPIAFVKTQACYDYYCDDGISTDVCLHTHLRQIRVQ